MAAMNAREWADFLRDKRGRYAAAHKFIQLTKGWPEHTAANELVELLEAYAIVTKELANDI
jgi:hypothetical protein